MPIYTEHGLIAIVKGTPTIVISTALVAFRFLYILHRSSILFIHCSSCFEQK